MKMICMHMKIPQELFIKYTTSKAARDIYKLCWNISVRLLWQLQQVVALDRSVSQINKLSRSKAI